MTEKEQQQYVDEPSNWLFTEAVEARNIQECGTFRRALSYRIEKCLMPILALIISKVDRHHNLDLLFEADRPWQKDLWMQLFQCREIVLMSSENVTQLQSQQFVQEEIQFACRFPFSAALRSVIKDHMETYYEEGRLQYFMKKKIP